MPETNASSAPKCGEGNTNPSPPKPKQINPSKKWCFTLNNPQVRHTEYLIQKMPMLCKRLVWQMERGANGTQHVQGACEFKDRCRPVGKCRELNGAHWEKMKAQGLEAYEYCCKDDTREENWEPYCHGYVREEKLHLLANDDMWPWQAEMKAYLDANPDARKIRWLWEATGGVGKSAFVKKMCGERQDCLCVSGKTADMHHAIIKWKEETGGWPKVILVDVPRDTIDFINYGAIEKVKDGCFYSGKYEGGMCVMNVPHVVFFANERPKLHKFSVDRWDIHVIKDRMLVPDEVLDEV